jgi:hypothetical protein
MQNALIIIGIISFVNWTYKTQLKWGNYLYKIQKEKKLPQKLTFLRKIWWSEFDFYRDYDMEQMLLEAYYKK